MSASEQGTRTTRRSPGGAAMTLGEKLTFGAVLTFGVSLAVAQPLSDRPSGYGGGSEASDVTFPQPPPKPPRDADLIEYFSTPDSRNRYLLDLGNLSRGEQESVRFTLLVETSGGVRNLRHEAIRCATLDRRILAIGRADGTWSLTPNSPWQPIGIGATNLGYHDLQKVLCFGGPQAGRDEVARRLRAGLKQPNF